MKRERFKESELVAVARPHFLGWTPTVGERVRQRSGSPPLLVHQVQADVVVVSLGGRLFRMPRACVEPDGLLVA